MKYIFIFDEKNKIWYLKINSMEELVDYHEKTISGKYDDAITMYLRDGHPDDILSKLSPKERCEKQQDKAFKQLQLAILYAERIPCGTFYDGISNLDLKIFQSQMQTLNDYGEIYINKNGGHCMNISYQQWCQRNKLVFPDFKESDIRIKRFDGGNHYYAYVGEMEVHNGETLKYNKREDAYAAAISIIQNTDSK